MCIGRESGSVVLILHVLVVAHPHQFDGTGMRRDGGGGRGEDGIIHWLIRYQKGNISIHLHLFKLFFNFNFF